MKDKVTFEQLLLLLRNFCFLWQLRIVIDIVFKIERDWSLPEQEFDLSFVLLLELSFLGFFGGLLELRLCFHGYKLLNIASF